MVGAWLRDAQALDDKGRVIAAHLDLRTDAELMRLLDAGHIEAFELLYKRHRGVALALACRVVGDYAMAEEVVQDAFVTLWRQSASYKTERGGVRSWVLAIVQNGAIDTLRKKLRAERREPLGAEGLRERTPGPDFTSIEVARRELARRVHAELGALPPEQQEVIELAFLSELSSSEIALTLELPLGTVKGRLRLGLQKLRRSYAALEDLAA